MIVGNLLVQKADAGDCRIVHWRVDHPSLDECAGQFRLSCRWRHRIRLRSEGRRVGRHMGDTQTIWAVSEEKPRGQWHAASRQVWQRTLGLAVTGSSPGRGEAWPGKPVGLDLSSRLPTRRTIRVERHVWQGDRIQNKEQSAQAALNLLKEYLQARV